MKSLLLALAVAVSAQFAAAQNTVKLFDAVPIDVSTTDRAFASKQVYLNCPAGGQNQSWLTGPNGGQLVVDNYALLNGEIVTGPWGNLFNTTFADPIFYVGEPMEMAYYGINPVDVSAKIQTSGLYTFELYDYGYTFGSNEVYLTTSCSFAADKTQVCHKNMGQSGAKTLTVGPESLAAHLAHGDTEGPCK
jgi:hypothetical protein